MITLSIIENTRQRLAMQMLGAQVCVTDALTAAARLEPHLEPPNILGEITPEPSGGGLPSLLRPSGQQVFQEHPLALFEGCSDLGAIHLPHEWIPQFLNWAMRHQRWTQFTRCRALLQAADVLGQSVASLSVTDGIVAGLLLHQSPPAADSPLRQRLFALAMTHPAGAFVVGESHHLASERSTIFDALQGNSKFIHWLSELPPFRELALRQARANFSLRSALTLVRLSVSSEELGIWLQKVAVAACHDPMAAAAALTLQTNAPEKQRALWLSTLQRPAAARWAFETVWWARHIWPRPDWEKLKEALRATATSDRGACWFNWSLVESDFIYQDYQGRDIDPLWSVELLHQRDLARLPVDDRPLRNQMVERLIHAHGDPLATLVLGYLDKFQSGSAK